MQILFYNNRKSDMVAWDASGAAAAGAFLSLFRHLKDDWGVYDDLENPNESTETYQVALYREAVKGNATAAKTLLELRQRHEYERWTLVEADSVSLKKIGGFQKPVSDDKTVASVPTQDRKKAFDEASYEASHQALAGKMIVVSAAEAILVLSQIEIALERNDSSSAMHSWGEIRGFEAIKSIARMADEMLKGATQINHLLKPYIKKDDKKNQ